MGCSHHKQHRACRPAREKIELPALIHAVCTGIPSSSRSFHEPTDDTTVVIGDIFQRIPPARTEPTEDPHRKPAQKTAVSPLRYPENCEVRNSPQVPQVPFISIRLYRPSTNLLGNPKGSFASPLCVRVVSPRRRVQRPCSGMAGMAPGSEALLAAVRSVLVSAASHHLAGIELRASSVVAVRFVVDGEYVEVCLDAMMLLRKAEISQRQLYVEKALRDGFASHSTSTRTAAQRLWPQYEPPVGNCTDPVSCALLRSALWLFPLLSLHLPHRSGCRGRHHQTRGLAPQLQGRPLASCRQCSSQASNQHARRRASQRDISTILEDARARSHFGSQCDTLHVPRKP